MAPIVLAYWDIRGLAQPIRLLLEQSGLEWEDKLYRCGPPPTFDNSAWFAEKPTLPLDFPNLPYLLDGEVKLTQSIAILRYIARKANLDGQTEEEKQRMDLIEAEMKDLNSAFIALCYNPNFETLKGPYLESLPGKLQQVSKFLGTRPFFAGPNLEKVERSSSKRFTRYEEFSKKVRDGCRRQRRWARTWKSARQHLRPQILKDHDAPLSTAYQKLTYVDFLVYEALDQHKVLSPECLKGFANLEAFVERIEGLPKIAAFMKSPRFIKHPLNNKMASFGG